MRSEAAVTPETTASPVWIVAQEWVVGDDGRDIRLGQILERAVRLTDQEDDGDLKSVVAPLAGDVADGPMIYVWHADDPCPPVTVRGTIMRIWALSRSEPDGTSQADGLRQVSIATSDWGVDLYVFEVDGDVIPSGED